MRYSRKIERKRESDGCLNRYNFVYVRQDTVNTGLTIFKKPVPFSIKTTANQVDQGAERRLQQDITQGGKEVRRTASIIIRQALEELYKTPFCILGNVGWKKYNQALGKVKRIATKAGRRKRKYIKSFKT